MSAKSSLKAKRQPDLNTKNTKAQKGDARHKADVGKLRYSGVPPTINEELKGTTFGTAKGRPTLRTQGINADIKPKRKPPNRGRTRNLVH